VNSKDRNKKSLFFIIQFHVTLQVLVQTERNPYNEPYNMLVMQFKENNSDYFGSTWIRLD
jgi:hypothetical protein